MPYSLDDSALLKASIDARIQKLYAYIAEENMTQRLGLSETFNATQIDFLTDALNTHNAQPHIRLEKGLAAYASSTPDQVMTTIERIFYDPQMSQWDNTANLLSALSRRQALINEIGTIDALVDKTHAKLYASPNRTAETTDMRSNTELGVFMIGMTSLMGYGFFAPDLINNIPTTIIVSILCTSTFGIVRSKQALRIERDAISKPILREKFIASLKSKQESCETNMQPYIQKFPFR